MPDPIYKEIGALIKARRKALGWKQESLAQTMDISRGSLANIELGRQSVLIHQLYKFAAKLEVRPTDLLPTRQVESSKSGRDQLPIPSDLKPQQKKQIADLLSQVDTSETMNQENNHAKATRR